MNNFQSFKKNLKMKIFTEIKTIGLEIQFSIEILFLILKVFSKNLTLHWFLAKTRKYLPVGFLMSFELLQIFNNPSTLR